MKFRLILDPDKAEEVAVTAHHRSELTDAIETLVRRYSHTDRLTVYSEEDLLQLRFQDIECITVLEGKTLVIDRKGTRYRLKQRLYEAEQNLPACFIRINKSTLANENHLVRFTATYSGGVDAVFRCGYTDYVSRRCFAQIKRRYEGK